MEDLALFIGTIAARLRRGSVRVWDPLRLVRPGLLGVVGIPPKEVSGGFFVWGNASLWRRGYFCWSASIGVLGSFRLYHRRAVEARLPFLRGSI